MFHSCTIYHHRIFEVADARVLIFFTIYSSPNQPDIIRGNTIMTKKEAQSEANTISDVLRIRDIIFGEQMSEYDHRFNEVDAQLQSLQAQLAAQNTAAQERLQQTTVDTQQQIADLESMLIAKLDALDVKATARVDLGDMLSELGDRLKKG